MDATRHWTHLIGALILFLLGLLTGRVGGRGLRYGYVGITLIGLVIVVLMVLVATGKF
jgi:hypothetical protein